MFDGTYIHNKTVAFLSFLWSYALCLSHSRKNSGSVCNWTAQSADPTDVLHCHTWTLIAWWCHFSNYKTAEWPCSSIWLTHKHTTPFLTSITSYTFSLFMLCLFFCLFFLSLVCRHTHTVIQKHAVTCAETDTGVLSCYNLYCTQSTGVLSLSFHSTVHTWNRDTHIHTHTRQVQSVSHMYTARNWVRKQEKHFIKLPITSLSSGSTHQQYK